MKDLTRKQYLKCRKYYWVQRAGPSHINCKYGALLFGPKFSIKKPKSYGKWPDFIEYNNDMTYDELNSFNKKTWRELNCE